MMHAAAALQGNSRGFDFHQQECARLAPLEDFTPPQRRGEARELLERFVQDCQTRQRVAAIRINTLEADGMIDLAAAMRTRPDVIAYPMSDSAAQMHALHTAITHREAALGKLRTALNFSGG